MKAVIIYLVLNTVIWLLRHLEISRAKRQSFLLDSDYPVGRGGALPKVSVLVAARNESANIERCLRSLLRQEYGGLEIIAVNDRSEDNTGEIIDRIAAEGNGRLKPVHVQKLTPGWLGKSNAMHMGAEQATGDWLCFTDADCFFVCPGAIHIGVKFAMDRNIDLLSVLPVLETSSFWERVLQPVCSAVLMLWFRPERVNNPDHPRAYANGAFMLFKRSCYEALGGHGAVRAKINEDMEFARLAKAHDQRLFVVQNRDLYRTRMYESFGATFRGWTRIFYGCFARLGWAILAAAMLLVMSILPYLVFLSGIGIATVHGWSLSNLGGWVIAWSGIAIVAQMSVITRFYRILGMSWLRAMGYPLGAGVVFAMLLSASSKFFGHQIVWRGCQIKTGKTAV